jgi:hypothetical protein
VRGRSKKQEEKPRAVSLHALTEASVNDAASGTISSSYLNRSRSLIKAIQHCAVQDTGDAVNVRSDGQQITTNMDDRWTSRKPGRLSEGER